MLPFEDRYTRQRQLPEVGHGGQTRIARHRAVASSSLEADYLRRAGVQHVETRHDTDPGTTEQWAHASHFTFAGPAQLGHAAHAALRQIKAALDE